MCFYCTVHIDINVTGQLIAYAHSQIFTTYVRTYIWFSMSMYDQCHCFFVMYVHTYVYVDMYVADTKFIVIVAQLI